MMKNRTKLQKYLFTLLFVLINSLLVAQFSRQQATDLVLDDIIAGDTINVEVFSLFDNQSVQDSIVLYNGEKIACPYSENWVFFINDHPAANWQHSCRYIFIDTISGTDSIITKRIYPDDWKINYETVNLPYQIGTSPISTNTALISGGLDPNSNYYAVILCGVDQQRYWYDISGVYNTLISVYGYTEENIFVLYENGNSIYGSDLNNDGLNNDLDFPANYYDVDRLFRNLSGELNDSDIPELLPNTQLFLFIDGQGDTDVPGVSYAILNDFVLYDYDLAAYLEDIKSSQMIIMLEPSYSGGFIDDLSDYSNYNVSCKNRSIHTAASDDEISWAEMHMTWEGNVFMYFADEFVWYWNAAARGYFPVYDQPWLNTDVPIESYPFGDITTWEGHPPAYDPDINGDGFVQMEEAFDYTNNFDTYSQFGFFAPYILAEENPQEWSDISFQEDLLTLSGLAGHVENTQTVEDRNYLIGGNLEIDPNNVLTFEDGTDIFLTNVNTQINVASDATLIIEDNVDMFGLSYENKLEVNGWLGIGQQVSFNYLDIDLNYHNLITTFDHTTFNQSTLRNYGLGLNISNSTFNGNCVAYSFNGNVTANSTLFNNTWLYLEHSGAGQSQDLTAVITNCNFNTIYTMAAININYYPKFYVNGNTINGYYNGIQLIRSGDGTSGNQSISDNEIKNCTQAAIYTYNSTAKFEDNYIHDNKYGLRLYNNSNIELDGNSDAEIYSETQRIVDNVSYELYSSSGSFPWYMRYNVIIDEDNGGNPNDPLVYYEDGSGGTQVADVRYNCWGDNFVPLEDLYPATGVYIVDPTWCPPYGGGQKSSEIVLQDFLDGKEHFENEEYVEADSVFRQIIENHPKVEYAEAAMKELLSLEKFLDDDYGALQQYYETNDSIQADSVLHKLSVFLANKCDVELENWQLAIDHYEDIIENPDTPEDSIFAIIDLGYVYFLMDTTARELAVGRMPEHKPDSRETFEAKTNYLLSLLPFKKTEKKDNDDSGLLKNGQLTQNIPNPFSDKTTVSFSIEEQSEVVIKVLTYQGRVVREIGLSKPAGLYQVEIEMGGLPGGIYLYSLFINGQLSDTKKMVLMK